MALMRQSLKVSYTSSLRAHTLGARPQGFDGDRRVALMRQSLKASYTSSLRAHTLGARPEGFEGDRRVALICL